MLVRILGAIQVCPDGDGAASTDVPSATQRRLLAILAVQSGATIRGELLAEHLGVGLAALRQSVARLRRLLGADAIATDATGYRLVADVDADLAAGLLARNAHDADRIDTLERTVAYWRGPALEEFRTEAWAQGPAARLTQLHRDATEELVGALIDAGRAGDALVRIEPHLALYPYEDRPRGLFLRALAASGRQPDALRAYQSYRGTLAEELGTEPGPALRAIEQRIATGWIGLDVEVPVPVPMPATRSLAVGASARAIPVPASSWFGSTEHLRHLAKDLDRHRIVTLLGPGGVGKTRSALEIARYGAELFADGVRFVELAAVSSPHDVSAAVLSQLDAPADHGSGVDAVVSALRGRSLLLILDNCEHVVEAAAELVEAVAAQVSTVTVLLTSRERLGVEGEHVASVETLDAADALDLFVDRARAADSTFDLASGDLEIVASICAHLDRLPLAIELAAARIRSFGLADLLAQLDDRFALLGRARRNGVAHHRTLRATVEWSVALLAADERLLFERLSIFAGSFDLAGALAVGRDDATSGTADLLGSLVDKCMVTVERSASGVRYGMLETIRQFGRDRLVERGELDDVAQRQFDHVLELLERNAALWFSPRQLEADAVLDLEWDNIRSAVAFAVRRGDVRRATVVLDRTFPHAHYRMRAEHAAWCSAVAGVGDAANGNGAHAQALNAWWTMVLGDGLLACELAARALQDCEPDTDVEGLCLSVAAFANWSAGQRSVASLHAARLDPLIAGLEPWSQFTAHRALFSFSRRDGFSARAGHLGVIAERIGAPSMVASARFYQANAKLADPVPATNDAIRLHEEGIVLARSCSAHLPEGQNLQGLVEVKVATHAPDAMGVCHDGLVRLFELRYWLWLWRIADFAALLLADAGDLDAAALVIGHLDAHVPAWRPEPRAKTRSRCAPEFASTFEIGARMDRESLVAHVLERLAARRVGSNGVGPETAPLRKAER